MPLLHREHTHLYACAESWHPPSLKTKSNCPRVRVQAMPIDLSLVTRVSDNKIKREESVSVFLLGVSKYVESLIKRNEIL